MDTKDNEGLRVAPETVAGLSASIPHAEDRKTKRALAAGICPSCKVELLLETMAGVIRVRREDGVRAKCPKCNSDYILP